MSVFDDCLSKIKSAVYGKDVRTAIHDALAYLKQNMAGTYTLPVATGDVLGGIKLGDDFALDTANKLKFNHGYIPSEYDPDSHKLDFLYVGLDGNVVPVPLLNSTFKLGEDEEGNLTGLEFSTSGRLWLMQFVLQTIVASEFHSTIDISEEFITNPTSKFTQVTAEVHRHGFITFGTVKMSGGSVQYDDTLFTIVEDFRPVNTNGIVCACQTFAGDYVKNDSNITINSDGTVKFFASDNATPVDTVIFSFSYLSTNGLVLESESDV